MIEEPKEDGVYWFLPVLGATAILHKTAFGWSLNYGEPYHEWTTFAHAIVAIEPVTPPSWERKP